MSSAYKIGVTVAMTNLVSAELFKIISQFGSANTAAADFSKRMLVVGGAVGTVAAALSAGVNEARKFQTEMAKFSLFGMDDQTNTQARRFAENMKVAGTSATDAMKLMVEAQGIFRESGKSGSDALRSAEMFAPYMAKMDFVTKAINGGDDSKVHAENQAMLRFIDMMGGNVSGARAKELVDFGFKLTESTGGNVDWAKLRDFRMHGRSAAANLTPEAIAKLEPLIQEYQGNAGTSLATAFMRLNGLSKPPNQAVHEMIDAGLWNPNDVVFNSMGGIKNFKPGKNPLVDNELFAHDPEAWYEKHIVPLYASRHYTDAQKARENAIFFGRTGGDLFTGLDRQMSVIPGALDSYRRAKSLDDAVAIVGKTMDGQMVEITAQWSTLMKNIGTDILPAVNVGLTLVSETLKGLNAFFGWKRATAETIGAPRTAEESLSYWKNKVAGSGGVPPPSSQQGGVTINHSTILDTKVIASSVTKYQVDGVAGFAPSSPSGFDGRMSLAGVN